MATTTRDSSFDAGSSQPSPVIPVRYPTPRGGQRPRGGGYYPDPYEKALRSTTSPSFYAVDKREKPVEPPPRAPIVAAPLPRAWTLDGEPVLLAELPSDRMREQARALALVGDRVTVRIAGRACVLARAH